MAMVNMNDFLNEFVSNMFFWPIVVGVVIGLPVFGYFYNRFIDGLGEHEHTSIYVTGGIFVTILTAALISWKAALLFLVLFGLDGVPMIVGDYLRGKRLAKKQQQQPRRKRLPYAANALIDDARMAGEEAARLLNVALKKHDNREATLAMLAQELATLRIKLTEVKQIQVDEK
jgi:hypothetical protein